MKEDIKKIIADRLGISTDEIEDDADIMDEYGADSLDAVEMLMTLEEMFEIQIPDEEAIELRTVRKILNYLEENR